ncbi:MAG: ABC transporter ATP-binding protein [Mycobacteriales bacterium]
MRQGSSITVPPSLDAAAGAAAAGADAGPHPVAALDVREVSKSFRRRSSIRGHQSRTGWSRLRRRPSERYPAVDHVSLRVEPGEIYGVIGANGSGKSTLVRILSTLLLPDAGSVQVFGHDVVAEPLAVRRLVNRVSADPSFFRPMSPLENLLFFGRAYGLTGAEARGRGLEILAELGLDGRRAREPMLRLSRGQQQKVAVARAFLTKPRLMLLDEPTTGLDPRSKRDVQRFIAEARSNAGVTILLTTHDMEEADLLCDRLSFLAGGRIVAEGTPLQLREEVANGRPVEAVDMEAVFMDLTGRSLEEDEDDGVHD